MTTCTERLETKTEIISGPNKSLGDKEGQSGRYPGFLSISPDLFPAVGGNRGLFLRTFRLLILHVVSYMF